VKKLDVLGKQGVVIDKEQRQILCDFADQAHLAAVASGEEMPDLFTAAELKEKKR
jgi:hypothetical protein